MDRASRVSAAINEAASAAGVPVAVDHVCLACARATAGSGVGLYVISGLGLCESLAVAGPLGEQVAELQVMLGEGPGHRGVAGRPRPVGTCLWTVRAAVVSGWLSHAGRTALSPSRSQGVNGKGPGRFGRAPYLAGMKGMNLS